MLLDFYTLGLVMIIARGFYIARRADSCIPLWKRLVALSPSLIAMVLFQRVFYDSEFYLEPSLEFTAAVIGIWAAFIGYSSVSVTKLLGSCSIQRNDIQEHGQS